MRMCVLLEVCKHETCSRPPHSPFACDPPHSFCISLSLLSHIHVHTHTYRRRKDEIESKAKTLHDLQQQLEQDSAALDQLKVGGWGGGL